MRTILGIVAGLVAAYIVIILIGIAGVGATYSVPRDIDIYDSRAVTELLLNMPAAPRIALLIALFGGTVVGAALAKRISRRAIAAWVVAIVYALLAALSVLTLPLAGWVQALTIAMPVLGGLFANHLVRGGEPAIAESAAATTDDA
jgi:hypothetical protein